MDARPRQYCFRLHDSASGNHYELTLNLGDNQVWVASWLQRNGVGLVVPDGRTGQVEHADAERAFRAAKRIIEDGDLAVMGNDWDFGRPPPAWLDE